MKKKNVLSLLVLSSGSPSRLGFRSLRLMRLESRSSTIDYPIDFQATKEIDER